MCAAIEKHLVISGQESYLNHIKFKDNHAAKVREFFDEKISDLDAPIPQPTQAHTFDFNCTYMGVQLIDGEVKAKYSPSASSVLVLHLAEQLAYKWSALAMLTTNNSITFYESHKDTDTGRKDLHHVL